MAAVSADLVLVLVLSATALEDDALVPDEIGRGLDQLQAAVARLGGGGLRTVKQPLDRTHQQVVKRDGRGVGILVLVLSFFSSSVLSTFAFSLEVSLVGFLDSALSIP